MQARQAAAAISAAVIREFANAGDEVDVSIVLMPGNGPDAEEPQAAA